ncbi:MAG: ABC transporter substrate-binding protein [Methanomicrobiaceae archaeon]|nr:ABC transporter substrate-binding protein [Methanomicrobiaceae archaeon]
MQILGLDAKKLFIFGVIIAVIFFVFLISNAYPGLIAKNTDDKPTVYLLYASSGPMLQLLNTGQADAFIVWEPVVATSELAGIGKQIAEPSDIPPKGKWAEAASCVLVLRNDIIEKYPNISALLSALTTAAINLTNEDPENAKIISAAWVFGNGKILTPTGYLNPLDVENESFNDIVFTAYAKPVESGIVGEIVNDGDADADYDPDDMTDNAVLKAGEKLLLGTPLPVAGTNEEIPTLNIGYLPSTDNFAPLYVMVKNSSYFYEKYGFCLLPDDESSPRPVHCSLMYRGETIARINLIQGQSGGGLMTTIGQKSLEGAYVGSVPAEMQIALGNPSSIIQSINTGGTGLVVDTDYPCKDWNSFIEWIEERSAASDPAVIATVQSSIQEDMIREAFACENITVMIYGTNSELSYP